MSDRAKRIELLKEDAKERYRVALEYIHSHDPNMRNAHPAHLMAKHALLNRPKLMLGLIEASDSTSRVG